MSVSVSACYFVGDNNAATGVDLTHQNALSSLLLLQICYSRTVQSGLAGIICTLGYCWNQKFLLLHSCRIGDGWLHLVGTGG